MRLLLILPLLLISVSSLAQFNTEVYLADLVITDDTFEIKYVTNISGNPGYDSQPYFFPDGSGLMYASTRDSSTDVKAYSITLNQSRWLTNVIGGEYSPTVMPDPEYFSAIRLKPDGEQLLWKFPFEGGEPEVIVPGEVIGYHTWLNEDLLYTFVLGSPATFVEFNVNTGDRKVLMDNPGRSLHKIPGTEKVSFVDKNEAQWIIKSYDPATESFEVITPTLPGSEDMAWTPDGHIVMGSGNTVALWKEGHGWSSPITVFQEEGTISRVAVNPDGTKLAIVFEAE